MIPFPSIFIFVLGKAKSLLMGNPKTILSIVLSVIVVFAGFYAYNKIYERGENSVQQKWDLVEAQRNAVIADLIIEKNKKEAELKDKAAQQQKVSNEKIVNLNNRIATISRELQNRPDRPSGADVPSNPTAGEGATGAQLYRPDAEFLIGEAARAEKVRIQLETCTNQYNMVYDAFLEFEKK